jgi:AraC-like DNA-binding protein
MQSITPLLQLIEHEHRPEIEQLVAELESWPDLITMMHRFDEQCTYTSDQTCKLLGYTATTWNVEFLSAITHPDDIFSINEKMYGYLIEAGKPFYDKEGPNVLKIFGRLQHANGRYVPVEFSGVILQYNSAGSFHLGLGVYQDISARMADDALKQKSEKLTRTLEERLQLIKSLYVRMYPYQGKGHSSWQAATNGGVSKIHIVDTEQLAIKVKHNMEIQKILARHAPGSQVLSNAGDIGIEDLPFVTQVIQCIEQQLADPAFSTEKFAGALNMSRGYLYKKIMRTFSVSPTDLIKRMRLDKGALLLQATDKSITDIAFDVGFTDSSYFSKCFAAQHGVTPLEFRKSGR